MDKIIAVCGNNCAACPRYVAHPFEPKCREVCTDEEYEMLKEAFFEKEINLKRIERE